MSGNIFVTSDSHFLHSNFLKFTDDKGNLIRPFKDAKEMDETMIERWNSVVRPQDKVYHLGDVYLGNQELAKKILSSLNGHKRLILGNHDKGKDTILQMYFDKIMIWRVFREFKMILSHIPLHHSSLKGDDWINVHGHIHYKNSPNGPYINVCVEKTNYTPVPIEELKL